MLLHFEFTVLLIVGVWELSGSLSPFHVKDVFIIALYYFLSPPPCSPLPCFGQWCPFSIGREKNLGTGSVPFLIFAWCVKSAKRHDNKTISGAKILVSHLSWRRIFLSPISTCSDVAHGCTRQLTACAVVGKKWLLWLWELCLRREHWGLFSDIKQKL